MNTSFEMVKDWPALAKACGYHVEAVAERCNTSSEWSRTDPAPTIALEPQPAVGEAFFINALGTRTWRRTYSVWP